MLSVAIKNTILLFLIVLILHFMIKKYLFDHRHPVVAPQVITAPANLLPPVEAFDASSTPAAAVGPVSTTTAIANVRINGELEEQLLKYVMANSPSPGSTTHTLAANKVAEVTSCGAPSFQDFPVETTIKKGGASKEERGCSSFMVVNEYDAENGLNGGMIFGSLTGYNSSCDDFFSTIDVGPAGGGCQEFKS